MIRGLLSAFVLASLIVAEPFEPARFVSGNLPAQSPLALSAGQVLLQLGLDSSGKVSDVSVLRSTPPFTGLLLEVIQTWRFEPARVVVAGEQKTPVDSRVLVAGWFRPPRLYSGALLGEPLQTFAGPSRDLPFPTSTTMPNYPPGALYDQVVLVEVDVGEDGTVTDAKIKHSAAGFDTAALAAARQWTFRPARRDGAPVRSVAVIVFAFRQPVT